MREREQDTLGLTVEHLLHVKVDFRRKQELRAKTSGFVMELSPPTTLRPDWPCIQPQALPRFPASVTELIETLNSEIFLTDPLQLNVLCERTQKTKEQRKGQSRELEELTSHRAGRESRLGRLCSLGVCHFGLGSGYCVFDDLVSYSVEVRLQRKLSISFDLRSFLYISIVIPHGETA